MEIYLVVGLGQVTNQVYPNYLKGLRKNTQFPGLTQEVREKEMVCACTLENSSGAFEAHPDWILLVCSPLILRIQRTGLNHHFSF